MPRRARTLHALLLALCVALSCTWKAWTPEGQGLGTRDTRVPPTPRSETLLLNTSRVDELRCYARRCQKRFRLAVDEPGRLTLRVVPELAGPDEQMRIVVETTRGVVSRAASGRGQRSGPTVLVVDESVQPALYFLLVESFGARVRYELTVHFEPEAAPAPSAGKAAARPALPPGPPPRLVPVEVRGVGGAGFDPAVSFDRIRTFAFPPSLSPEEAREAGAPMEQPLDRQIRRLIAEELRWKGLRQATGDRGADVIVDFSGRRFVSSYPELPFIYGWYELDPARVAYRRDPDARATLGVDLVETRSRRIAWHAWTTRGLGPGITPGEKTRALVREAVHDVLAGFPPR